MTVREFYDAWDFDMDDGGFILDFQDGGMLSICKLDKILIEAFGDVIIEKVRHNWQEKQVVLVPKMERIVVHATPSPNLEVLK